MALTAHTVKGDEERCLAAGMDGYLAKPIRTPELDSLLDSFIARKNGGEDEKGSAEEAVSVEATR